MRKFSKRILKLALALAVVGLGLSIGGVAMGATITGINLTKYGRQRMTKKSLRLTRYRIWIFP